MAAVLASLPTLAWCEGAVSQSKATAVLLGILILAKETVDL